MTNYLHNPRQNARQGAALLIVLMVVALLAAAGGVTYYAAKKGYINVPYLTPQPPTVEEIGKYIMGIRSAEVSTEINLKTEDKTDEVVAMVLPEKEGGEDKEDSGANDFGKGMLAGMIGSDLLLDAKTTTSFMAGQNDQHSSFSGTLTTGGLAIAFDMDLLTAKGSNYVKVKQLPIPFVDVSPLADKWIDVSDGLDLEFGNADGFSIMGDEDDLKKAMAEKDKGGMAEKAENEDGLTEFKQAIAAIWQRTIEHGVWRQQSIDSKAEYEGKPAWKMGVTFDAEAFRQAWISLADDPPPGLELDDEKERVEMKAEMDKPETKAFLQNLAANTKAEFLVLKEDRRPVSLTFTSLFAPPADEELGTGDKQARLTVKVTYDKVGETFNYDAPPEALTTKEAMALMMGSGADEAADEAGTTNAEVSDEPSAFSQYLKVMELQAALKSYRNENGAFPSSLEGLFGQKIEGASDDRAYVIRIPADAFTEAPMPYRLTESGYEFDYYMAAPDAKIAPDSPVGAMHTASEKFLSLQAAALDEDGDGLSYAQEAEHGTYASSWDSDKDGFSDGDEVAGGYDPLQNAQTGESVEATIPDRMLSFDLIPDLAEEESGAEPMSAETEN